MRAVLLDGFGDEEVLRVGSAPAPALEPGNVRIGVAATAVNRADLMQRRGLYPPPAGASEILGLECAGEILELGEGVEGCSVGDRVMALLAGGGYAEEVVTPAGCTMPVPARLGLEHAAAVPEVFLTAHLNLFEIARVAPGESVLVHGGSGGVGTAAIQLLSAAGARCLVTAGSPERCRRCLELGAEAAVDHHADDAFEQLRAANRGRDVDVVLDCIGGPYLADHLQLLALDGRLVVIGLIGGASAQLDLRRLLQRRLTIVGSTLRSRSVDFKASLIGSFLARFGPALEAASIFPVVDRILPLESVADAHRLLASGEVFGKLVLQVGPAATADA